MSGRRVRVVGRYARGMDVICETEMHFGVQGVELIKPAVSSHDCGFLLTQDLVRAHDH